MDSIKRKEKKSFRSWFCKYNLFSVTLIAFGISSCLYLPDYIHKQMMKNLEIRPGSRPYDGWKKPTIPLYLDIYIFNWTNPEDITNSSTKPILQQIGPYRFRDYPDKHNITFHDNNSTVSYKKSSTYYFEPEMSDGTLDDVINTVNLVALGAAATTQYSNVIKQVLVSKGLNLFDQKIHVVKTVREILFEGYEDSMLTAGTIFSTDSAHFKTVGFMVNKNASDFFSGKYTVHTGVDDIKELGKIKKYNDIKYFPHATNECRKLKGSPGEFYPPERNITETIDLFTPEMCRSLPYEYDKNVKIQGLKANRYFLGHLAIDNGTLYQENKCYFQSEMPSGVWNRTDCSFGTPFYISYPHFYLADSSYSQAVEGLSSQKDLHESYMILDEKLSITLETAARFQMNALLGPFGSIALYKNVPKILMPLFYIEQVFKMNEEHASELYYGLLIYSISLYIGYILITLGLLCLLCRKINCCCRRDVLDKKDIKESLVLVSKVNIK